MVVAQINKPGCRPWNKPIKGKWAKPFGGVLACPHPHVCIMLQVALSMNTHTCTHTMDNLHCGGPKLMRYLPGGSSVIPERASHEQSWWTAGREGAWCKQVKYNRHLSACCRPLRGQSDGSKDGGGSLLWQGRTNVTQTRTVRAWENKWSVFYSKRV